MSDEYQDEMTQPRRASTEVIVMPASIPQRLLPEPSAAQYIGRTQKGIQALRAKGLIPYHRIDRRVHYDIRDLDAWIEKHKVKEREER